MQIHVHNVAFDRNHHELFFIRTFLITCSMTISLPHTLNSSLKTQSTMGLPPPFWPPTHWLSFSLQFKWVSCSLESTFSGKNSLSLVRHFLLSLNTTFPWGNFGRSLYLLLLGIRFQLGPLVPLQVIFILFSFIPLFSEILTICTTPKKTLWTAVLSWSNQIFYFLKIYSTFKS